MCKMRTFCILHIFATTDVVALRLLSMYLIYSKMLKIIYIFVLQPNESMNVIR